MLLLTLILAKGTNPRANLIARMVSNVPMRDFISDLQYGLRTFVRTPGFTLIALLALALGIGATTVIFSVVDTVLLKPLPYPQPDRIVSIGLTGFGQESLVFAPDYLDWRERNTVFDEIAAYSTATYTLTGQGEPVRIQCGRFAQSFFRTLRIQPILGRAFTPAEDRPGASKVVLLTYGMWQRRFGGSRDVLGKSLAFDSVPYTIIGVLGPQFRYPAGRVEAVIPMALDVAEEQKRRAIYICPALARLKDGMTIAQARAQIEGYLDQTRQSYPKFYRRDMKISMVPLLERQVANVRLALLALLGAVVLVLFIACANVANLLLTRAAGRHREIAVRAALGAGRLRLIRQLLTESAMLGFAGGALGLLLTIASIQSLVRFAPPLPRIDDVAIDYRVLGFTLLISLAVSLVFGLAPALGASRVDLTDSLKQGARGSASLHRGLRNLLVVGEVALSLVLLAGAGLLIQTLWRLQHVNTGIDTAHVVTTQIPLSSKQYDEASQRVLLGKVLERVSRLPGVLSAALCDSPPPEAFTMSMMFNVEGRPRHYFSEPGYDVHVRNVTTSYFATFGIPLRSGRLFDSHDNQAAPKVALVNEALVRRFFPNENPIGKHVGGPEEKDWMTVVGVVADVKNDGLAKPPIPELIVPAQQSTMSVPTTLLVRTIGDPTALIAAVRDQVRNADRNVPLTFTTMRQEFEGLVSTQRFNSALLSVFAGLALLLAAIGIYGVMSYLVTQRTQEIGIRMALGAQRIHVLKLVVGQALRLVIAGVVTGTLLALALTHYLASLLYGVTTRDAGTFCSVAILLSAVALLASYIPARRAANVDPLNALRCE